MNDDVDAVVCARCGRETFEASEEFPQWEMFEGELICDGCLTREEEQDIHDDYVKDFPHQAIPRLVQEFEARRITAQAFEDGLVEQALFIEQMTEAEHEGAAEAEKLLEDALAKLPPESLGDTLAQVYRALDRLPEEVRERIDELAEGNEGEDEEPPWDEDEGQT